MLVKNYNPEINRFQFAYIILELACILCQYLSSEMHHIHGDNMQAEFQDAIIITRKTSIVLFAMYVRDSYFFVHILLTLKYLSQR